MKRIHLLHIGKTGGSALKAALRPVAKSHGLVLNKHNTLLTDIAAGMSAVFSVRHPVDRYVSSFNSRLRKGYPLHYNDWTAGEATAFSYFKTPNVLAESLSSSNSALRSRAEISMNSIYHVSHRLTNWLISADYMEERRSDIWFIFEQKHLSEDFTIFKKLADLPQEIQLPSDPTIAHRTPEHLSTELTPLARVNLENWYHGDMVLFRHCQRLRDNLIEQAAA